LATAKAKSDTYDASSIQVLEGLEPVRKRPGMYIGTTSSRGLHHLVYEVVDNAIDEAMAGRCDRIDVTLHADGSASIADNGGGIPVKSIPGARDRRPAVEVVLSVLHAGGKFGGGGYQISGGLHGVGVSVVNALSEKLEATIMREGFTWTMVSSRGKVTKKLTKGKPSKKTGTMIRFWPDPEVFTETLEFKREILSERLQELAFLNKGVEIRLIDEREDPARKDVFRASGGLVDFVKHLATGKDPISRVIPIDDKADDAEVERLRRVGLLVREHDQHARGRHARGGPEEVPHERAEPLRAHEGAPQGEGGEPDRRGRARGSRGDPVGEAPRAPVRGPDEDEARERLDALVRGDHRQRAAG
jgi:DNA gyrase subunit B